jgi:hypothetical protein
MDNLTIQLNSIGLTDSDIDVDEKIESIDKLVLYVSSSNRLFRKTIKHLILRDIKLYFDNDSIGLNDDLKGLFPRKGRKTEWIKFSYYFDLKVPELKLTKFSIILITILAISVVTLILWLVFGQTELLIHSIATKVPLIPIVLMTAILQLGLIGMFGQTDLPAKTIGELADEIISKNLSDLLTDDKKKYKEIIARELTAD